MTKQEYNRVTAAELWPMMKQKFLNEIASCCRSFPVVVESKLGNTGVIVKTTSGERISIKCDAENIQINESLQVIDFGENAAERYMIAGFSGGGGGGGGGDIPIATTTTLGGVIVGDNLTVSPEGRLSVQTVNAVKQDNTKPITSAAVYTEVGNINALLALI